MPLEALGAQLLVQTNAPGVGLSTIWVAWTGSTATNQVSVPIDPENGSMFLRLVYRSTTVGAAPAGSWVTRGSATQ